MKDFIDNYRLPAFAILTFLGLVTNLFPVTLHYRVDLIFGGIFGLLAICLLHPVPGVLAAAIIAIPTYFIWNHPLAIAMYTIEAILIAYLVKKTRFHLLTSAGIVWLFLLPPFVYAGMTISKLFFPAAISLFTIKYTINGIFNAAVATIILFAVNQLVPETFFSNKTIRASEAATNFFVVFTIIPLLIFMLLDSRLLSEEILSRLQSRHRSLEKVAGQSLQNCREKHILAIRTIASRITETGFNDIEHLQDILETCNKAFPGFSSIYIADQNAAAVAFYPPVVSSGSQTVLLDFSDRPYFRKVLETLKPSVSFLQTNLVEPAENIIVFTEPIIINNQLAGYVSGKLTPEVLGNSIQPLLENSLKVTLFDDQDRVIFSNRGLKVLSRKGLTDGCTITNLRGKLKLLQPDSKMIASKRFLHSTIFSESQLSGTEDWVLIIEEPMAELIEKLFQVSFRQFSNILVLLIVILLFSELVRRFFSLPLIKLAHYTNQMARTGQFAQDASLPVSNILEIQHLVSNFSEAMTIINESHENEKVQNERLLSANLQLEEKISQLKAAQFKINEVEKSFAVLVNNSPFLIIIANAAGLVEFVNNAFLQQTQINDAENKPLESVLKDFSPHGSMPFAKDALISELVQESGITKTCLSGELLFVKNEEAIIFTCIATLVDNRCIVILSDITEIALAKEVQRKMDEQLQNTQKLESLGILASGVAHDFNNILLSILGYAELTLAELPKNHPLRENIQMIDTAAQRAAKLTSQMLAYTGHNHFISKPFDLTDLVKEMIALITVSISKLITIKYSLDNQAWASGDATQIRQIVMNMLLNAGEAIGEKAGNIAISTGMCRRDDFHMQSAMLNFCEENAEAYSFFEIVDNGCGIEEKDLQKIFDPFFTTKFTGRGLGLAASMGIVKAHRGAIFVSSQPGRGSCFRLMLPVTDEVVKIHSESIEAPQIQINGKILLVDDEETVLTITQLMLEASNLEVIVAHDGKEAVEKFTEMHNEIALVILDLVMPKMKGEEAFIHMKNIAPSIPIIISSGFTRDETSSRLARSKFDGFIQKPFKRLTLLQEIEQVLRRTDEVA